MSFSSHGTTHRSTVTGQRGMIASAHPLASLAGLRILMQGGNAIDAAVATAAALNVTEPYMSGMAGDGYMHIYSAEKNEHVVLDYMGRTPFAARPELYANEEIYSKGTLTHLVPGACGGWMAALERYGSMDPLDVFMPAIEYAEQGYPVTVKNAMFYNWDAPNLLQHSAGVQTYLNAEGKRNVGDIVKQPNLGRTLRLVAKEGASAFYRGEIADRIVHHMSENGGLLTHKDMQAFEVEWQAPVMVDYRGYKIYAPAPPCQANQYLEALNIMEGFDVAGMGHNSAETLHAFIEASKLAQADRIAYTIGEDVPTSGMLSKAYAAERRKEIGERARPSMGERYLPRTYPNGIEPGDPRSWQQAECTTHFDSADSRGNAVAVTQSLGGLFGSSVVIPETGLAMNNFVRWADVEPDSPNVIAGHKKIEMCMSPIQVWDDAGLRFMIGTPGSYGIMHTTPQMIMNIIDQDMNVQAAIEAPRVKATSPGLVVDIEDRVSAEVRAALEAKGHELNLLGDYSMMVGGGQGIQIDPESGAFMGGADPRRDGYAIGW